MAGPKAKKKAVSASDDLASFLRAEALQARAGVEVTFREFLTSTHYCAVKPSPAVAAIVNASEGRPVTTITEAECQTIFGCALADLPTVAHRVVGVSAGGRGGKTSKLLAPKALHAAWTVRLRAPGEPVDPAYPLAPEVAPGEHVAAIIIAPKRKLAKQAFSMVKGYVEASPILRAALVGEPTGESLTLRRPDGLLVDIMVAVADKGGASARSRTLVFCGLDEASFFSSEGAAVNDEDIFSAAIQRVVPGGQLWIVSTPWIEEEGVLEGFIKRDRGKHINSLVASRVGTRLLNPTWDPDGSIERTERARPGGAENADREILALPLPKGSRSYFSTTDIALALQKLVPVAQPEEVGAGADIGHADGGDNSALNIAARFEGGLFGALCNLELAGGNGQKTSDTYEAFARQLVAHRCATVAADVHYKETFKETLGAYNIQFVDAASKDRVYAGTRTLLVEQRLALGSLPEAIREGIAEQLRSIVSTPLGNGRFKITAPRRKVGDMGVSISLGHCDSVSALTLSLWRCGSLDPSTWVQREAAAGTFDEDDDFEARDAPRGYERPIDTSALQWRH